MNVAGFIHDRAQKAAVASLSRSGRLEPGEQIRAYGVGHNLHPPHGRLELVWTTRAIFIGAHVNGSYRFPLAEVVDGLLRIARGDGSHIEISVEDTIEPHGGSWMSSPNAGGVTRLDSVEMPGRPARSTQGSLQRKSSFPAR